MATPRSSREQRTPGERNRKIALATRLLPLQLFRARTPQQIETNETTRNAISMPASKPLPVSERTSNGMPKPQKTDDPLTRGFPCMLSEARMPNAQQNAAATLKKYLRSNLIQVPKPKIRSRVEPNSAVRTSSDLIFSRSSNFMFFSHQPSIRTYGRSVQYKTRGQPVIRSMFSPSGPWNLRPHHELIQHCREGGRRSSGPVCPMTRGSRRKMSRSGHRFHVDDFDATRR